MGWKLNLSAILAVLIGLGTKYFTTAPQYALGPLGPNGPHGLLPFWISECGRGQNADCKQHFPPYPILPPAKSPLAEFPWPEKHVPTKEEISLFHSEGFVIFRNVVSQEAVDFLRKIAAERCTGLLGFMPSCSLEQSRWTMDAVRDFLFYGPVGHLASHLLGNIPVRVIQEGIFGHRYAGNDPKHFFSYSPHVDTSEQIGLSGGLRSDSPTLNVWMPLHDVDSDVDGGSVNVVHKFPQSPCPPMFGVRPTYSTQFNSSLINSECTGEKIQKNATALSFRKGDIGMWSSLMLHSTQPIKREEFVRYAWYARIAGGDSTMCNYLCTTSLPFAFGGYGMMPCCNHGLQSGDKSTQYVSRRLAQRR